MRSFFDAIRPLFGTLSTVQVQRIEAILYGFNGKGLSTQHQAYILATGFLESDRFRTLEEYGKGRGKAYGKPGRNHGQIPYGRGLVQITWDENYEKADKRLGLNGALIRDYNLATRLDIAVTILIRGMVEGWFTGKKLSDFKTYKAMRAIVNGKDRADLIAQYAEAFEDALATIQQPLDHVPVQTPDKPSRSVALTGIGALVAAIIAFLRSKGWI